MRVCASGAVGPSPIAIGPVPWENRALSMGKRSTDSRDLGSQHLMRKIVMLLDRTHYLFSLAHLGYVYMCKIELVCASIRLRIRIANEFRSMGKPSTVSWENRAPTLGISLLRKIRMVEKNKT